MRFHAKLPQFLSEQNEASYTGHAVPTAAYLRNVVNAEGWWQLVSVCERDLVRGSLQSDLCPQEETVPQCVPG